MVDLADNVGNYTIVSVSSSENNGLASRLQHAYPINPERGGTTQFGLMAEETIERLKGTDVSTVESNFAGSKSKLDT